MINTSELRRLAQAALAGPDGTSLSWIKFLQDFQQKAGPTTILELLDRLEAAEKSDAESLAMYRKARDERDALRALVVMRFDHDRPPQFTQGYDTHELTEPVTAEHCRWFVDEIERLRAKLEAAEKERDAARKCADMLALALNTSNHERDALRAKVESIERQEPVAWTTKLALEYGASRLGFQVSDVNMWGENGVPLYALPGAQTQGEEK